MLCGYANTALMHPFITEPKAQDIREYISSEKLGDEKNIFCPLTKPSTRQFCDSSVHFTRVSIAFPRSGMLCALSESLTLFCCLLVPHPQSLPRAHLGRTSSPWELKASLSHLSKTVPVTSAVSCAVWHQMEPLNWKQWNSSSRTAFQRWLVPSESALTTGV